LKSLKVAGYSPSTKHFLTIKDKEQTALSLTGPSTQKKKDQNKSKVEFGPKLTQILVLIP